MILERRSQAGKVLYRSVSGGWNGSEEDKYRLHEQLELLQKDPTYLSSDTTLPELNNEMAPVRQRRCVLTLVLRPPSWGLHWLMGKLKWTEFGLMLLFYFLSDVSYPVDECCLWLHPSNIWWPSLLKLVRKHSPTMSAAFSAKTRQGTVLLLIYQKCSGAESCCCIKMLPELSGGWSDVLVCPIIAIMQPLLIKVEATWRQQGVLLVTNGCCVFLLHTSITKRFSP